MREVLEPYINDGFISYFYLPNRCQQQQHYNQVYDKCAKAECSWLIVCDVDEYIYSVTPNSNIKHIITTTINPEISVIFLTWKMFGSSGFEKQPMSIRESFVRRKNLYPEFNYKKYIVFTCKTTSLDIHKPAIFVGKTITDPNGLKLNHYAIMSREYFFKVKATRGDAYWSHLQEFRDAAYFNRYDLTDETDEELRNLVLSASLHTSHKPSKEDSQQG